MKPLLRTASLEVDEDDGDFIVREKGSLVAARLSREAAGQLAALLEREEELR